MASPLTRLLRLQLWRWASTPATGAGVTKSPSIYSLLPTIWTLVRCPYNYRVSLRRKNPAERLAPTTAGDGNDAQKAFLELLPRGRDGILTEKDWRFLTRAAHQADEERGSCKNATRRLCSKGEVKRYNGTKLRELGTSVLKVEAKHSCPAALRATADLAQGLQRDAFLARGARVMLTRNLRSEVWLVNGIRGEVVDIVWAQWEKAPTLPEFTVSRLKGYTGPVWSSDPRHQECMPVPPFETSWSTTRDESSQDSRRQLPLALCWSITMHTSKRHTMDKAVIDLGKSEATVGLIFFCLSRVKHLGDLLIEPMPFERLSKRGEKHTFQLRLRKEIRLEALAGETLGLHGGGARLLSIHI